MKITNALATVVAAGAIGFIGTPIAAADDLTTTTIGNEARLTNGNVVQGWTITNLKPSTDVIPYPVAGTLWEATATDQAIEGSVTPIVSNLNARAKSGETYRVLFGVATPQGVNPQPSPRASRPRARCTSLATPERKPAVFAQVKKSRTRPRHTDRNVKFCQWVGQYRFYGETNDACASSCRDAASGERRATCR